MVFELYDPPGGDLQISEAMRDRFRRVVQNADLIAPLQKNILEDAKKALETGAPRKIRSLVEKVKYPLKKEEILSIKQEDIGKFT